ncbi:MAG: transglycosylase SLT domain-containing protein [Rhizobiaceae bacterium]|nr:transglycosylase SLT domain-containing protein [Rhizobiaceae bacterium]
MTDYTPSARQAQTESMNSLRDLNLDRMTAGIISIESANNPNAKNPNSSATGLGQFISSTWMGMMSKHYPDLVSTMTKQQVLDLRYDPAYAKAMTKAYLDENLAALEKKGISVTPAAAYLSHFLGPGAASKALTAAPSTPVSSIVTKDVLAANSFMKGWSTKELIGWADRKMGRNMPSLSDTPAIGRGSASSAPVSKSNLSAAAKEYQYAGVTKAAAPTDVAKYAYTSRFRDMYISPHYTLEQQGLTQADLDRQTPEVDRAVISPGQKAEVGAAQQNASVGQPSVGQPSTSQQAAANAPTSSNVPANTPTEQPANPAVADTPATQPDETTTEQKRGTGAQVVAGGIDVLAGMIPGIGIGASVFNAGAALTGNRTIGERLVDDFASGDNPGGPVTSREADSLLERETQTHGGSKVDSTASDEAAPAKDVNRFVRLYLQTPTEKWGRNKGLMTASA